MPKEGSIEFEGIVKELLPNAMFKVKLDNGHDIIGHLSGRMRKNHIKILEKDKVDLEISAYDVSKGRIVYRYK